MSGWVKWVVYLYSVACWYVTLLIETGDDDRDFIPLGGVFHYAIWIVKNRKLFLAAAHEDRELPLWIKVGMSK